MESSTNSVSEKQLTPEEPPLVNPTADRGSANRGRKKQANYSKNKTTNSDYSTDLATLITKRLKMIEPPMISDIKPRSSVVPTIVLISFYGLIALITELWTRMRTFGLEPFSALDSDANFKIFLKCSLYICEAKLAYAQNTFTHYDHLTLPYVNTFTELQLRILHTLSKSMPYPLVIC